jgi:SAM-dependent methyltransferase
MKKLENYDENFINMKLSPDTIYVYTVRKLLQKAVDRNINKFKGILVDLGCGEMPYKQYILDKNKNITKYIGIDVDCNKYHQSIKPDLIWDGKKIELEDGEINTVIATELFEHLSNIEIVLEDIYRVLAKDGGLFFTVPFIWPLHETPHDEYRYTPYSLKRILEKAGFNDISITPLGGYNASLAQMLGIWIYNHRNKLNSIFKKRLFEKFEKCVLYPIIKKLLKKDSTLSTDSYGENSMPTGFYGYAKK